MTIRIGRSLILFFVLCTALDLAAQTTTVSGRIQDGTTHEALSYVNVSVKETGVGTTTDSAGYFSLPITPQHSQIQVSMIGYEHKAIKIQPGTTSLNIDLKTTNTVLKELVVKPGKKHKRVIDTAALYVLAQVIGHKDGNNPEAIPHYYLHEHTKLVMSMVQASPKFTNAKLFKPYSFFFEKRDTSIDGEEYIPLGILEEYNETYHAASPRLDRKVIHYRHLSGFKKHYVSDYLSDQFNTIDIYRNVYVMMNKSFTSPFSPGARATYSYHILDTIRSDGQVSYKMNFVAKNKADVALKGYVVVDSATWGISSIYFRPNEKANVNFLTDYTVEQQYENTSHGWVMKYETLNARGNLLEQKGKMAFLIKKVTAHDAIQLDRDIPANVSNAKDNIVLKDAYRKDVRLIDSLRISPLDAAEENVYHSYDTASSLKSFKTLQWMGNLFTTGNFRAGPIDFGRAYYLVSRNAVEGYRFRLGAFTNDQFSKTVYLYAQGAYGTLDKKWKYEFDARIKLPSHSNRWNELWIQNKNDMIELGRDNPKFSYDNVLTLISPASKYNKVMHTSSHSIEWQTDWFKGLSSKVAGSFNRYYSTTRGFEFQKYDDAGTMLKGFNTTELSAELRYCANDQYTENYGIRYFRPTTKPSFTFKYTWGIKNPLTGDYAYHKLEANVAHTIYMPIVGYGKLQAKAGVIFGDAPYPVTFIPGANIGVFRDETAYQLTSLYEFAHDKYVSLWYEHHFEGLLFNHIPYVSKLKLREFLTVKALWGDMKNSNKTLLRLPEEMHTTNKGPYVEVGVGIENILKVIQVSAVWRATYRDAGTPNFAIKIAIKPSF